MNVQETIYRHLREYADKLNPPAPFTDHVEISGGNIIVIMAPMGTHEMVAWKISDLLRPQLPEGIIAHTGGDVEDVALGILRRPDVIVVPYEAMHIDGALNPRDLLLAIEIVSPSNPANDYVDKLAEYPMMGIPHYLIVDPRDGTAQHYWQIVQRNGRPEYDAHVPYVFGDSIPVGDWVVDTTELPRYGTAAQ
jgi:Uma2 family endonuclease